MKQGQTAGFAKVPLLIHGRFEFGPSGPGKAAAGLPSQRCHPATPYGFGRNRGMHPVKGRPFGFRHRALKLALAKV